MPGIIVNAKIESVEDKPQRRHRKKRGGTKSLGVKNKPFKLHDYCHPSSGYVMTGGAGS